MKLPAAAFVALLLAACNSQQPGNGNGTAANRSVAAGPSAAAQMRPGRWEMTMRVASVEMPSAAPEMQEQLRSQLPPPQVSRSCLSPEDAANPVTNFQRQVTQNPAMSCTLNDSIFAGGTIRISMTCSAANGQAEQRVAMVGGFTDSTVQMAVSADSVTTATPGATPTAVRIQSTLTGRRLGECDGTETG
jgi:hypothetical protein